VIRDPSQRPGFGKTAPASRSTIIPVQAWCRRTDWQPTAASANVCALCSLSLVEEGLLRRAVDELVARRPTPTSEFSRLNSTLRPALAWGALNHPDPPARRLSLDYLDHLAGPEAAETLVAALDDPVPRVRRHAIHARSCHACKPDSWCVDAANPLRRIVANDPSAKIRFEALRALLGQLDPLSRVGAIQAVIDADDRPLLNEAIQARRRSVPTDLRACAEGFFMRQRLSDAAF
jgi:hypothetical protein